VGSRKRVTLACDRQFRDTVWDALREEAGISDLSMTSASRCTFEFTTEDPHAILGRSVFVVCHVQASVVDA